MKRSLVAAIVAAINAYIEQEEQARLLSQPTRVIPYIEINPWRLFGRQELMRARTRWHIRKVSR